MTTHTSEDLRTLEKFDVCVTAETMTGKGPDDETTQALGLRLHLAKSKKLKALALATRDTWYSMTYGDACIIASDLGFVEVLQDTFTLQHKSEPQIEELTMWWHPEHKLLLKLDTHSNRESLNSAECHFALKVQGERNTWPMERLSGGFEAVADGQCKPDRFGDDWKPTHFIGHKNVDTGLRAWMRAVAQSECRFDSWPRAGRYWHYISLISWWEYRKTDGTSVSQEEFGPLARAATVNRIARLPEHVRKEVENYYGKGDDVEKTA